MSVGGDWRFKWGRVAVQISPQVFVFAFFSVEKQGGGVSQIWAFFSEKTQTRVKKRGVFIT